MLPFESLNEIRQLTQAREKRRNAQAEQLFQEALEQLDMFLSTPSQQHLNQLRSLISETLRLKSTQPRPLIMIAYLLLLAGNLRQSIRFQQLAESLAPDSDEVRRMRELIQDAVSSTPMNIPQSEVQQTNTVNTLEDSHYLYDQTEDRIRACIKGIMLRPPLPGPNLDPADCQMVQSLLTEFEEDHAEFVSNLESLEAEWDISELKRLLLPMEKFLTRLKKQRNLFRLFLELDQAMHRQIQNVTVLRLELTNNKKSPESQAMEQLYDACDALADQLDQLEEQGLLISPFMENYNLLKTGIEALQETLDESFSEQLIHENEP